MHLMQDMLSVVFATLTVTGFLHRRGWFSQVPSIPLQLHVAFINRFYCIPKPMKGPQTAIIRKKKVPLDWLWSTDITDHL